MNRPNSGTVPALVTSLAVTVTLLGSSAAPVAQKVAKFYADDPIAREPETQDASKAEESDIGLSADLLYNLFARPGDRTTNVRAQNVNTIDEVPDSSWFTNRIYTRTLSTDDIARGPNTIEGPAPGRWTVIRPKSAGAAPGFTARDGKGETWFVSFDGRDSAVGASAAAMIASRLFHALGYNQVETYLTTIRPEDIVVADTAMVRAHGKRRRMTRKDVDDVLERSARSADGSYRAAVGRLIPGRVLGGFRYYGTRPDDPNDVVPHEHRRELRALKVFGAWTNLVDIKAGNTVDAVVTVNNRGIVRHYLQDVGSTFGMGANAPHQPDEGYEYLYEGGPLLARLLTLGFYIRPWQVIGYPGNEQIGRFQADHFEPEDWRPRVPAAALLHARADDTFWAALRVMAFTDEQIRAAVRTGRYTDPAAETLLADILIARRDKIGRVYYSRINPLVGFALDDTGALTFQNPAVRAKVASAPAAGYEASWYRFNNGTGETVALGRPTTSSEERLSSPVPLPTEANAFVKVSVRALKPSEASWAVPVDVYFRRSGTTWRLVGVERLTEPSRSRRSDTSTARRRLSRTPRHHKTERTPHGQRVEPHAHR